MARRRWWIAPIALVLGGIAFYVLLQDGSVGSMTAGPAPLDRIDDASREQLEDVLAEADRRAETRP